MSGRNVVICCDGTANEFAENKTNVIKLFSVLDHDPARQITYYHPGLGTMEPTGALTIFSRKLTTILGKAIGYGLSNDIRDAYVFLMREFRDALFRFRLAEHDESQYSEQTSARNESHGGAVYSIHVKAILKRVLTSGTRGVCWR